MNKADNTLLKKTIIILLAFIGFLTTIELARVYYNANFDRFAAPSFCSINSFINCDDVARTIHSQFFGVPLAYWGMFFYLFILMLVFADKLKQIKFLGFLEVFKNPYSYIATLGIISFLISMALAGVSLFEIHKICILCVFTYFLNLLIALFAIDYQAGLLASFKASIKDFIDALKIKKYLITAVILAIIASGVLTYTTMSNVFTPQVVRFNNIKEFMSYKSNPYKVTGNILGDEDADFTVYIYTDYRCPICRIYNIITHKAAKELGGFEIVHKNLPLDNTCNPNIKRPFHEGSCMLSRYAIAAEKQNHFWDMNSQIFEQQPKTEEDILKMAETLGLNTTELKKDANSKETKKRLNDEIAEATKLGIDGTPTIVIDNQLYVGIKPYKDLKDILLKAGAFERQK